MHSQPVVVRAQGVGRERHGGECLAGAEHAHPVAVDQGPTVQGGDGADRPVDVAAGGAGALAVVGHDEAVAEALAAVAHSVERGLGPAWFLNLRPAPGVEVEEAAGRHVLVLLKLEYERRFAAGDHQEQAHSMLRNAKVCAVHDMRRDLVAQRLDCSNPSRIERPLDKLLHVLYDASFGPVVLNRRDHRPGCGSRRIVLWISGRFAAGLRVTLAAWRGQQ